MKIFCSRIAFQHKNVSNMFVRKSRVVYVQVPEFTVCSGMQIVVFEVGDHPPAGRDHKGNFGLPYVTHKNDFDQAELKRLKKAVEPFL